MSKALAFQKNTNESLLARGGEEGGSQLTDGKKDNDHGKPRPESTKIFKVSTDELV